MLTSGSGIIFSQAHSLCTLINLQVGFFFLLLKYILDVERGACSTLNKLFCVYVPQNLTLVLKRTPSPLSPGEPIKVLHALSVVP